MKTAEQQQWQSLGKVRIKVPYRAPGNVTRHVPVEFEVDVAGNKNVFRAKPLADEKTSRLVNVPSVMNFVVDNGWVKAKNKKYTYTALDIFNAVKEKMQP